MAGERLRRAKNQANMAFNVGLDDLMSTLDFRDKWNTFKQEVNAANKKAQRKSGLMSFVRTAVFYAAAVATGGMSSIPLKAAISAGASAAGGMLADQWYGDLKAPKTPEMRASKFNKARNIEKYGQLEDSYTELEGDIDLAEQSINSAHYIEPLTNALAFYGPELAKGVADGSIGLNWFKGLGKGGEMFNHLMTPGGTSGMTESGNFLASAGSSVDIGSGMQVASTSAGTSDMSMDSDVAASVASNPSNSSVDWAAIEGVLDTLRTDVDALQNAPSSNTVPMGESYGMSDDYDFSDEIADSMT